MQLPNLLATRLGRLSAFFFRYVTEGIPLGFGATAIATQLRRADVGPAEGWSQLQRLSALLCGAVHRAASSASAARRRPTSMPFQFTKATSARLCTKLVSLSASA